MEEFETLTPSGSLQPLVVIVLAAAAGACAAIILMPTWLPAISASLLGNAPKAYWYLARSSAFVAYILVWLAMIFGLLITSKTARIWPGGPITFDLHQHASLIGLAFALFHALVLLGDQYMATTLVQLLIPFQGNYRPIWVGLGQISLYVMALVGLSFYVRKQIGHALWRAIHFLSFVLFVGSLAHGIWSGTDTGLWWSNLLYWSTGGSVLFLATYRIVSSSVALKVKLPSARSIKNETMH